MSDGHVLHPSHSFVLRTIAGEEIDVGPLVNQLLTVRRNQERDIAKGTATQASTAGAAGFRVGMRDAILTLCGPDGADAFKRHCDELWELVQQDGPFH